MNTIAVTSRDKKSLGFHVVNLNELDEHVRVGEECLLDIPEATNLVRGSVVRIDPDENRCVIQILGMYNMF